MSTLPRGWMNTTIGAIATLDNGRAFKSNEWEKSGLPIIRIQNLNNVDASFNYFSGEVADRHKVQTGDLLFAWSGTPGTSFGAHIWRGTSAILNQHIFNIRVDTKSVNREYLRLAINQTLNEQIAKAHGGAGLRHLTKGAFESTKIALPPLAEQKRIVERIFVLEERSDFARHHLAATQAAIDKARAALLAASYDLTLLLKDERAAYKDGVPHVSIGDIALSLTYGTSAKSAASGKVPVLRMGNIQKGEVDWSDLVFTSDEREIERYRLTVGDVLFNRTNSPQLVGKTAIYRGDRPAVFAGYLIRIRCSEKMLPEYLTYCLNSPAGRQYCQLVKSDGVSQSNVNSKKLAAFMLPCPSIVHQRLLVDRVNRGLKKLAGIASEAGFASKNLDVLYKSLVDQALSGQWNMGLPSDESASIQIEELKAAKKIRTAASVVKAVKSERKKMRKVIDILREAKDWVPAQSLAEQYGIGFGSQTESVEPFFAELRELDVAEKLLVESIHDLAGKKIGQRLRLKSYT